MSKVRTPEPTGFSEFWSIWMPHRRKTDGRGDAREAYRKHILAGAEPQDIIDGARFFLRSLTDRDKAYIPLAASWLNKEAYADFVEEERTYQRRLEEARAKRDAQADRTNVVTLQQPDNRPSEQDRAKHAQAVMARAGFAAQG